MLNYRQLYQSSHFELPELGSIDAQPFPAHPVETRRDPLRDQHLQTFLEGTSDVDNCVSANSVSFQQLCAKQNLYPFMVKAGPSKVCVVCKDCLMLADWNQNLLGKVFEGGDQLIKLQKWERVKISEGPMSLTVGKFALYAGYQSGRIAQYVFRTKSWQGTCEEVEFPVMQLQVVNQEQVRDTSLLALDSAGNILQIIFSHKTFMDKIIKTMSSGRSVSFVFRNKKREKIKKLFRNLIAKKEKQIQTQPNSSQIVEVTTPYFYNHFCLRKVGKEYLLAVSRRGVLELLVLDQHLQLLRNIVVEQGGNSETPEGGWVELGEGGFHNANTRHNVLVWAVDDSVIFYRIVRVEEDYEVVRVSEVKVEEPLIYGKFVSNNLLLVQDSQSLYLSNVGDKPQKMLSLEIYKFSYIDFFIGQEGLEVDKKLLMGNLVDLLGPTSNGDQKFVSLLAKRLTVGTIYGWSSILEKLVFAKEWEQGLHTFEKIYSSSFKLCGGINQNIAERNLEMRNLCLKLSRGFWNKYLHLMKESEEEVCWINLWIWWMLKCEMGQMLFEEGQRLFVGELQNLLVGQLKRYVQQSNGYGLRLTFMSEKYLQMMIKVFKAEGKVYVLERLLMQFDLGQMQKLLLLGICLRQELYYSLVSICCEQKDFITPIVKLCGIGLNHPQQQDRMSDIIYWYLQECLSGRMTQYGNDEDYLQMLAMLINFIFIPSSLQMLLTANYRYLTIIIYTFFDPQVMRYILQNEGMFFMRKEESNEGLFEDHCLSQFKLYQRMLSTLICVVQESSQECRGNWEAQLNRLIITLMLRNHFPFLARIKIKIIRYLIDNPLLFMSANEPSQSMQFQVNGQLMRLLDSFVRSISQKCLSLREQASDDPDTVIEIQELMKTQKQKQLQGIIEQIMLSPFSQQLSETKCYIYHQVGRYSKVLELYLQMRNKQVRMKVFLYLQANINQFADLARQFLKYMLSFMKIDQPKTERLLWRIKSGWVDHEEIIQTLVDYPDVQLRYIEKVMRLEGEKSRKLLLRHLQIVLREHGDCIEEFISRIEYPLEQAFRMCEQRNNRMGKACILIKSGRNMEGVLIISEIFLQAVKQYLPVLKKTGDIDPEKRSKIFAHLKAVLITCHKQFMVDNDRGEDIWQKNAELIFRKLAIANIDTPHVPPVIKHFLNQIIDQILSGMLEEVSTDFFLNRFVKTFNNLPMRIFIRAYKYIQSRLDFTFTLQQLNRDIMREQEVELWDCIMTTIYRAHTCNLMCHSCQHKLTTNERMLTFTCGHVLHQECYYEQGIKTNKNQLCPLCYSGLESGLMFREDKPLRYRLEVDQNDLLRGKISRMGYYDRASQMSAMQNWGLSPQWGDI